MKTNNKLLKKLFYTATALIPLSGFTTEVFNESVEIHGNLWVQYAAGLGGDGNGFVDTDFLPNGTSADVFSMTMYSDQEKNARIQFVSDYGAGNNNYILGYVGGWRNTSTNTSRIGFLDSDGNWAFFTDTDDKIAFFIGQEPIMRLLANGNVGIGTISPTALLHVEDGDILLETGDLDISGGGIGITDGNITVTRSGTSPTLTLKNINAADDNDEPVIVMINNNEAQQEHEWQIRVDQSDDSDLEFRYRMNGGSSSTRLQLKTNGEIITRGLIRAQEDIILSSPGGDISMGSFTSTGQ